MRLLADGVQRCPECRAIWGDEDMCDHWMPLCWGCCQDNDHDPDEEGPDDAA